MKVLVSLGFFDDSGECRLVGVDLATGHSEVLLSYLPPPQLRVVSRGFTGACLSEDGRAVYAAGHAAVFRVNAQTWTVDGILHMPSFNDLHHVAAGGGRIYVSNTGSDEIDVFSTDGRFVGSYMLTPSWVLASKMHGLLPSLSIDVNDVGWEPGKGAGAQWHSSTTGAGRIEEDDGYHTAQSMRAVTPYWQGKLPDRLHPNHTCLLPTQTLVTCFRDGSIRDLGTLRVLYQRAGSFPHDGVGVDGWFYFTTIDGKVWALRLVDDVLGDSHRDMSAARDSVEPVRCWDIAEQTGRYGWCRGLLIRTDSEGISAAVGLTEVKRNRLPSHRWCDRTPEGSTTGVVWLDLTTGRQMGWVDLSDSERHSKIYSVLPWGGT